MKKDIILLMLFFVGLSIPAIGQKSMEFVSFENRAKGRHHIVIQTPENQDSIIEFKYIRRYHRCDSLKTEWECFLFKEHLIKGRAVKVANDYVSPYFLDKIQKSCYLYKAYNDSIEISIYLSIWNDIAYVDVKSLSEPQSKKLISRDTLYFFDKEYARGVDMDINYPKDNRTTEKVDIVTPIHVKYDHCLLAYTIDLDGLEIFQGLEIKQVIKLKEYEFRIFAYTIDSDRNAIDSLLVFEGVFKPKGESEIVRERDYSELYEKIDIPVIRVFSRNFCNYETLEIECELSINYEKANLYGPGPKECSYIPSSLSGVRIVPWVTMRSNSLLTYHNLPIDDETVILRFYEVD